MKRRQRGNALGLALIASLALLTSVGCVGGTTNLSRMGAVQVGGTGAAVVPPLGVLYSSVRAPAFAKAPEDMGMRRGEAAVRQIAIPPIPGIMPAIPLIAWGDASADKAASAGGITDMKHADYRITVVLMFFRKFTLTAYGD